MSGTPKIDRYVASYATLRDEELVGAVDSAEAQALLSNILRTPPRAHRPRRRPGLEPATSWVRFALSL